jgi:hypothetical protein
MAAVRSSKALLLLKKISRRAVRAPQGASSENARQKCFEAFSRQRRLILVIFRLPAGESF